MSRWIFEFDYDADPDTTADAVKADLTDHLTGARGPFRFESSRIILEDGDDALSVRLRFNENIVGYEVRSA